MSKPLLLNSDTWIEDEVQYVLDNNLVFGTRERLNIRDTVVRLDLLQRHVAMVGEVKMEKCTVSDTAVEAESPPHPKLHRLELKRVTGLSQLARSNLRLNSVTSLKLWHCPGARLSDVSTQTFPALSKLELWDVPYVQLDTQLPPTVRELELSNCDKVDLKAWQRVCPHLQQLVVKWFCEVLLGDRKDDVCPWNNLQELELGFSRVQTATGVLLYESTSGDVSLVREWLRSLCPKAQITIRTQEFSRSSLGEQLIEPEMIEAYQEACREGTQQVHRSRLMLLGHSGAGKTSLKNTLMYEMFDPDLENTIGIEKEDQTCVVDVETAIQRKKGTLDHKEEFKENIVGHLHIQLSRSREHQTLEDNSRRQTDGSAATSSTLGASNRDISSEPLKTAFDGVVDRALQNEIIGIVKMELPEEAGRKAVFVIWDFGGQQMYYTTHQTFLSRAAFYLIVMDLSKGLDEVIEAGSSHTTWNDSGSPRTSREFLDFWLKSVHTHLTHRGPKGVTPVAPPVIIVCTKKDLLDKDRQKRATHINKYIQSIRDHLEGKPYYKHVHDIVAISNCETDDPEVDRLRESIVDVAKKQPHWGEERPIKWLLLADKLAKESAARPAEPVLKFQEVVKIAEQFEVTTTSLSAFLHFYHNLGDLVHFDEAGTDDIVILSPQWLANMFSKVITHHRLERLDTLPDDQKELLRLGMLSTELAWSLPDVAHPHTLIKIMERFDMLIPCDVATGASVSSSVYLVPCLQQKVKEDKVEQSDPHIPSIHFKCIPTTEIGSEG